MASENETVAAAIAAVRKMIHECPAIKGGLGEFGYQLKANCAIDRIEAAHKREMKHQAVHNCELRAKSGLCGLRDEIKAHRREVAELVANLDALEKAMERVCSRDEVNEIIAIKKEIQDEGK